MTHKVKNILGGITVAEPPTRDSTVGLDLLFLHLHREMQMVEQEKPQEVRKRVFSLPRNEEAKELLTDLEEMRVDVLNAMNAIESVPRTHESFAARLQRMHKQEKIPREILEDLLLVALYRNKAVYEDYSLQPGEVEAVWKAISKVEIWAWPTSIRTTV